VSVFEPNGGAGCVAAQWVAAWADPVMHRLSAHRGSVRSGQADGIVVAGRSS